MDEAQRKKFEDAYLRLHKARFDAMYTEDLYDESLRVHALYMKGLCSYDFYCLHYRLYANDRRYAWKDKEDQRAIRG